MASIDINVTITLHLQRGQRAGADKVAQAISTLIEDYGETVFVGDPNALITPDTPIYQVGKVKTNSIGQYYGVGRIYNVTRNGNELICNKPGGAVEYFKIVQEWEDERGEYMEIRDPWGVVRVFSPEGTFDFECDHADITTIYIYGNAWVAPSDPNVD
jgi:hypothetical protein